MYALLIALFASVLVAVVLLLLLFLLSSALAAGQKGDNNSSRFSEHFSNATADPTKRMTGGAAAHELFLVDRFNFVLRAVDTRDYTLNATDAFRAESGEFLSDVAYSAESDTLFVASWNTTAENVVIRSFGRTNSSNQWNERHRVTFPDAHWNIISLRVLRDGTLFCWKKGTTGVHVCRVHADRSILNCTRLTLPTGHNGFDMQRVGDETRLAAALPNGSVALFRVDTAHVEQLSLVPLAGARDPLFVGDTLLLLSDNETHLVAVSFATAGGHLQRDERELITFNETLSIDSWCFANGRLFAWNFKSKEISIYS